MSLNQFCMDHGDMKGETVLKLDAKACNDTAGSTGLAPVMLVFGVVPRMQIHHDDLPAQQERMNAMLLDYEGMTNIMAKIRLNTSASRQVPSATDAGTKIEDMILVFQED